MILSITGHRPQDLPFGFSLPNPCYNYICKRLKEIFIEQKATKIVSGMALGVDQYAAYIATQLKIPFLAAIPFNGQENAWPVNSKKVYKVLLDKAVEKIIVCEGDYAPFKMQVRNQYMVDNSDALIAVWTGKEFGGTYNCIQYAKAQDKQIIYINPNDYKEEK